MTSRLVALLSLGLVVAGCDRLPWQAEEKQSAPGKSVPITAKPAEAAAQGTTPMNQRVAVLGFLNKRNGIARDLTLRPGQSVQIRDVIVRLRACETTPPWEFDQLTGAFVQVDVRQPTGQWKRVFSGWLYKESPSLNVVEHSVYDVWPKSCTMSFPAAAESSDAESNEASSADQSPADGSTERSRAAASNSV